MAIRDVKKIPLTTIKLVSMEDDAVDKTLSDVEEYKKTGDLNHLKFVENKQPTYFICNFELKRSEAEAIKNAMINGKDDEGNAKVALGSWSFKVAQMTLKDIQNPPDVPTEEQLVFKKDDKGYAHDSIIAKLDSFGIVNEIFGLYAALVLNKGVAANAKN